MCLGRSLLWVWLFTVSWTTATPVSCEEDGVSPQLNEALNELRASASAWRDNDAEFRALRRSSENIPRQEIEEFAKLVAELNRQLLENCRTVSELGGERFLDGYECWLPDKSVAKEVQSLDDELRRIEGEIDDMSRSAAGNRDTSPLRRKDRNVEINASRDGHFYVTAIVNGTPIRFLVDTGATMVALNLDDAGKLGFGKDVLNFSSSATRT